MVAKAKLYRVRITRTVRMGISFEVHATSEAQAQAMALECANEPDADWQEEATIDEKVGEATPC